jgi:hypothetical protein
MLWIGGGGKHWRALNHEPGDKNGALFIVWLRHTSLLCWKSHFWRPSPQDPKCSQLVLLFAGPRYYTTSTLASQTFTRKNGWRSGSQDWQVQVYRNESWTLITRHSTFLIRICSPSFLETTSESKSISYDQHNYLPRQNHHHKRHSSRNRSKYFFIFILICSPCFTFREVTWAAKPLRRQAS